MTPRPINPQLLLLQAPFPPFRALKFLQTQCGFVHRPCPNKLQEHHLLLKEETKLDSILGQAANVRLHA